MANKAVFNQGAHAQTPPMANVVNEAGGEAYALEPREALAQIAVTGTFNNTFYTSGFDQLATLQRYLGQVPLEFVARLALYSRHEGYLKDMPAFLLAWLTTQGEAGQLLVKAIFNRVCNSPKMVANFVQIMRSGAVGRNSLGTMSKRLVQDYLNTRRPEQLWEGFTGVTPSLADLLKMVHPAPPTEAQANFYNYVVEGYKGTPREGRPYNPSLLPETIQAYDAFVANPAAYPLPAVDHLRLDGVPGLTAAHWQDIGRGMSWWSLRMNLNTLLRHGCFADPEYVAQTASRLADEDAIRAAHAYPYQLLMAWLHADPAMPKPIKDALEAAMEIATGSVEALPGLRPVIIVDVSGSMRSPITGNRPGATSAARCVDVAALVASVFIRQNEQTLVVPVDTAVHSTKTLKRGAGIMTNAQTLAAFGGGGTALSAALAWLNAERVPADVVWVVSDNESWADWNQGTDHKTALWKRNHLSGNSTYFARQWQAFKAANPQAKLVLNDIQPYTTTQAQIDADVLNVGGFSDAVFDVVGNFVRGNRDWLDTIEATAL